MVQYNLQNNCFDMVLFSPVFCSLFVGLFCSLRLGKTYITWITGHSLLNVDFQTQTVLRKEYIV